MIELTHLFTYFRSLGGVQSMLKRHLARDSSHGIQSEIVAFFEPSTLDIPRVRGLGYDWRTCIRTARKRFGQSRMATVNRVGVYHGLWGVPFLADLDGANRRIGLLHSDLPRLERVLAAQRGLLDGVLYVSRALEDPLQRNLPELNDSRRVLIPYPVDPPPGAPVRQPLAGRPLVIGFNGRIAKAQKRVDRLPLLLRELDSAGVDYRFELLGEGPEKPWLERQIGRRPGVLFRGRVSGADYWNVLCGWDVILFTSDYEGLPISLLEAMSVGVIPLFPRIHCGGDPYVERVRSDLLYPSGDLAIAVQLAGRLQSAPEAGTCELRVRCSEAVAGHLGGRYDQVFGEFVRRIAFLPRISAFAFNPRGFRPADLCPFAILSRIFIGAYHRSADIKLPS